MAQQESAFREWCSQNGIIPGAIFADQARPGSSVIGRSGFQDMMHHFRSNAPEAGLVIWSYSRFARDIDDSQFFRADLRRRGYILYSLNDEIPDGPMGRLFEAAIDWKNAQFLEDLSRDVKRGLYDLVRTHGAVPGTPPVGFTRQVIHLGVRRDGRPRIGHRWVIDEAMADRVRRAFQMRAAGQPVAKIHTELRLYASLNSYTHLFGNELYIGKLRFGEMTVEDYCPAMIDEVTWQAVQAKLNEHAAHQNNRGQGHPRRQGNAYLLSGLAYCARCGSPLYGLSSLHKGTNYERYDCTRRKRRHDCDFQPVPRVALENAVLGQVSDYILTPDVQQAHQLIALHSQSRIQEQLITQRSDYQADLMAVKRKISNTTEALAESGKSRALLDKLTKLEAEEGALLSKLAEIERHLRTPAVIQNELQIQTNIGYLRSILATGDSGQIQIMLRGFIERITVDREGSIIRGAIEYFHPP